MDDTPMDRLRFQVSKASAEFQRLLKDVGKGCHRFEHPMSRRQKRAAELRRAA